MIDWAQKRLGDTTYAGWCLSFIEDALEKSNNIEIFGGDCAKKSARMYADSIKKGVPERGSFVFYDCLCKSAGKLFDWGHCGIGLGDGKVIHAWDTVRTDDYLAIETMLSSAGTHPKYMGFVPLCRVLSQKS